MPSANLEVPSAAARQARIAAAGALPLALLSAGHFAADLYSSALGALQPLLVSRFHMSLTDAGILGGLLVTSASTMQPLYGFFSDRMRTRLFCALGPAVAGIFISALGLAPSYGWLIAMVLLGGAGIAAFHPQASAMAAIAMQSRRAGAMALFISAGTLGLALGPTFFSLVTGRLGLHQSEWAAVPGLAISALLLWLLPASLLPERKTGVHADWHAMRAVWKPLLILYLLVFLRSVVQVTFTQFIPLYLHLERGYEVGAANYTLSLYLAFGALGGLLGGHMADRCGGRLTILVSMIGCVPFLGLFFLGHGLASVAGLLLGGLVLLFTIPVNVVMAQELLPGQAGTVSALMMGFAWGTAGLVFIPLTGYLSDLFSMHYALMALAAFPALGFLLALRLPHDAKR